MKANTYFLTVIIIFAIGAIMLNSCSKETGNAEPVNNKQTKTDQSIENRILHFKDKMAQIREHPHLKSGTELMEVDSVVWYIEAVLNYTYADASSPFNKLISDTSTMILSLENGKVNVVELTQAYDRLIDSITQQYNRIDASDKHLVLGDVTVIQSGENEALIQTTSGFGVGNPNPNDFGPDDYWYYGLGQIDMGGYCDGPYEGTETGLDAARQIAGTINLRNGISTGHTYYTDISQLTFDGLDEYSILLDGDDCGMCNLINPNDPNQGDNMYDWLIFRSYSEYPNHHDCLPPIEMNFYLDEMENIIYNLAYQWFPNELDGKDFIGIELIGEYINVNYTTIYFHYGTVSYGIENISSDPPEEF